MPTKKAAVKSAKTTESAQPKRSAKKAKAARAPGAVKGSAGDGNKTAKAAGAEKAAGTARGVSKTGSEALSRSSASRDAAKAKQGQVTEQNEGAAHAPAADLVDSQLAKYRSMRDFNQTEEPAGGSGESTQPVAATAVRSAAVRAKTQGGGLPFVIQKHAASHLHYDFRLGWSGVLKSWAVAKGPSFVTADRRLAVQVEDHPMEYGGFEGIIPKGQYGGGTVMVWDQGTWWPQLGHENVEAGLRTGSLKFEMHGTKMRGKWTLVRMHATKPFGGAEGRWKTSDKPQWLLIKEHDEFERAAGSEPVTEAEPNSALTGRTMEEIAQQSDHVWNSKETAQPGQAWYRQEPAAEAHAPEGGSPRETGATATSADRGSKKTLSVAPRRSAAAGAELPARTGGAAVARDAAAVTEVLEDLPTEPQPEFIQPQLAQETEQPPEGAGWLHELKLDGYRMQARKSARGVQMLTRSGLDWTYRVPAVADAVAALPFAAGTLDGEVVVLAENGTTNFADLQASFQNNEKHPLTFFCFDLLHLEGRNTRQLPLRERKALLSQVLPGADEGQDAIVRISEHLETSGRIMFEQACALHAEGIISKRAEEPYQNGRRASWLKAKCLHEQEFVVTGFTLSSDGPDRIGSLLLGYYVSAEAGTPEAGKLVYAGRTGTGFTQKQRRELRSQLAPFETKQMTPVRVPAEARRDAVWVRPELVAQVRFATWTAEDLVRQAAFLGLREDKRPGEVFREAPGKPPQPKSFGSRSGTSAHGTAAIPGSPGIGEDDGPLVKAQPAAKGGPAGRKTGAATAMAAAPKSLRLTHPQKVLDPESGLTKQQLADFYWAVAERMLPHVADRPLSLVRCPDGAGKPCFYQKHVNHMLPPGIGSVMVADKKGGTPEPYITLNSAEALAGLAQIGVLEVHPWSSRNGNLECPDRLIFDLDPDEALAWSVVAEAAMEVRSRLKKLGLESFLKTTGGKGLHIVAPITPEHDFATLKEAAHRFVQGMERANPRLYLTKMTKAARTGKIYLDYLRNERGATAVAPFSPRARPGVPASVTLDWKELAALQRPQFPVAEFAAWRERLSRDPWKKMGAARQSLDLASLRAL